MSNGLFGTGATLAFINMAIDLNDTGVDLLHDADKHTTTGRRVRSWYRWMLHEQAGAQQRE
jgi:hypothetical protein